MITLFLDVDEVLNIFPPHTPTEWADAQRANCNGFTITYSREMGDRLAALPCEIRWLTTWEDGANFWLAPLFGWDPAPVLPRGGETVWWKLDAIREVVERERQPFVWIDDQLSQYPEAEQWAASLDLPHMLVSPETHLTPSMLALVEQQVAKWAA